MKLPNGERAMVDIAKIIDYCLSPTHVRGRHKARVFEKALGLTQDGAQVLVTALVGAAATEEAFALGSDEYGCRYAVEFVMEGISGTKRVRSLWMIRNDEDFPRFLTCYVI